LCSLSTDSKGVAVEEEIKIVDYKENEDGSALIQIECSDFVKSMLIEAGFISLIKKHIEEMDSEQS
jgi:hypothetical protein